MQSSAFALTLPLVLASLTASAQGDGDANVLEEVTVLGSRALPRTAIATTVPVDIVTGDEILASGHSETARAIQALAPSFNFSTSTISDGTDALRPATLRGLNPDQILVLVNGRRRHKSALLHVNGSVGRGTAGTDLNAIPVSAIDHIEVMRDGASAQYGSDAIAGVINLVLKTDAGSGEFKVRGGQTYEGDGELLQAWFNGGLVLGDSGFVNFTLEHRDREPTNRAGLDPRQQYLPLPDGSPDPREKDFDRLNHRYGDSESDNDYLWVNGAIGLSDRAELYFYGGMSRRDAESGGFYRRSLDARNRPEIYPDGFLPLINTDIDDDSLAAGVRTALGGWDVDASVNWGENSFGFYISNSLNVSMGPDSPTSADAGELSYGQTSFNLDLTSEADVGFLARPLGMAFGLEYREERYAIEAGEPASYIDGGFPNQFGGRASPGIQVFPGFRPTNEVSEDRDNLGIYAEFAMDFNARSSLDVAVRYEDYSDFGSTLNGKLSGRYGFNDTVAVRGSASTGFRAPSLQQIYFNNTSTQFVFNDVTGELEPFDVGTFANNSRLVEALGVPELEEETSTNFSLGLVAEPTPEWTLTVDLYRIDVDDRILLSGLFQASNPEIGDILAPLGVNGAQFFTNAVNTETTGVDVVTSWERDYGTDRLRLTAAANWTDTDVVGEVATPPILEDLGEVLFNRIERERLESAQPDNVINLSAQWERGPFQATLRTIRYGEVKVVESNADTSRDQVFGAEWVVDLDLRWRSGNGWTVAVGANNLFDQYPDKNEDAISFNGIFPYPRRAAPFGFNGGFYYADISYRFDK